MKPTDLPSRLAALVRVDETSGCWPWTGFIRADGYGHRYWPPGRHSPQWLAHRLVYTLLVGPIPAGLVLDHTCRNRACVNPAHLEPVTFGENARRGEHHGLPNVNGFCRKGRHPWIPVNIRVLPSGVRNCKLCEKEKPSRQKAARASRKARPGPGQQPLL